LGWSAEVGRDGIVVTERLIVTENMRHAAARRQR
jgi:hypothetical protein